jgi:hypothetical protein
MDAHAMGGRPSLNICVIPRRWAVGMVRAAEQVLPVALVDHNWSDSVTDIAGRDPKLDEHRVTRGDYMILGEPGSRSLPPLKRDSFRAFLAPYLQIDSGTYEVKAEVLAEGVNLQFVPTTLPMGTIDTPEHMYEPLVLAGTKVSVVVDGSAGQVTVPVDQYTVPLTLGGRGTEVFTVTAATRPAEQ